MKLPINLTYPIPNLGDPGYFGTQRKFDVHTGIDLYCAEGEPVFAMEAGVVCGVEQFTGPNAGSPWWNSTEAILIEGESGVIVYGEIINITFTDGDRVEEGDFLGNVRTVLKKDKGVTPVTMLHLEQMKKGCYSSLIWNTDDPQPDCLLNPEHILFEALYEQSNMGNSNKSTK